jgi:very-short-patch-repair endonuclease
MPASFKSPSVAAARLDDHARCMCRNPTPSEYVHWQAIRGGRLGVQFRRQVSVGHYIVDFLAPRVRLVAEVDGGCHTARVAADARRQPGSSGRGISS